MKKNIIDIAHTALEIEAQSILDLKPRIGKAFLDAVQIIQNCSGKVIVTGIGKSGHIGKKIASTLSSTGTSSFFVHPSEAFHGDLGMISSNDVVICISYSGETDELLSLIPFLKENSNPIIAIVGNETSTLSKNADHCLNVRVEHEACPLSLAPTSSTTATLALGDALAIVLMENKGFREENFARFHPGGSLGRRLLTKVSDVMLQDDLPTVSPKSNIKEVVGSITRGQIGLTVVCDESQVVGIITDGDLRKSMDLKEEQFFSLQACDVMTRNPKTIEPSIKIREAEDKMNTDRINSLIVVSCDNKLQGVLLYKKLFA